MRLKQKLKYLQTDVRTGLAVVLAALGLSLLLYPAIWDAALGGMLEKVLPAPVYNAIHELRHLWGLPCH